MDKLDVGKPGYGAEISGACLMFMPIRQPAHPSYQFLQLIYRRFLCVMTLSLLTVNLAAQNDKDAPSLKKEPDSRPLPVGSAIVRQIGGGEVHIYQVELRRGQALLVKMVNTGIDAGLFIGEYSNMRIVAKSISGLGSSPGELTYVSEQDGELAVTVATRPSSPTGSYILFATANAATADDRQRMKAQTLFAESEQLAKTNVMEASNNAIKKLEESLSIWDGLGEAQWQGDVSNLLGKIHFKLGNRKTAAGYFDKALASFKAAQDKGGEAGVSMNLAGVHMGFGENQKALEYLAQGLRLFIEIGDKDGEAMALNNTGLAANTVGERQMALDLYNRALTQLRAAGNKAAEATALNNKGLVYIDLDEHQKAIGDFKSALELLKEVAGKDIESQVLNNLCSAYVVVGDGQKALDYCTRALSMQQSTGDKKAEASTLNNLGTAYGLLGQDGKAIEHFSRSLLLLRAVGSKTEEAATLANIMTVFSDLKDLRAATFYGKQAVNIYQGLRRTNQGLTQATRKTYLKTFEAAYRRLAVILLIQGRLIEAFQVINSFKDQQAFDFDQPGTKQPVPLALTPRESAFAVQYQEAADLVGRLNAQQEDIRAAPDKFLALLKHAEVEFSGPISEKDKIGDVADLIELATILRELSNQAGRPAVAIYTLTAGTTNYFSLIITSDTISAVRSVTGGENLNEKALQLWALLRSDKYDPTKLSHELYEVVFKPIEDELPKGTATIMWSLDGNLRYVPMAALYDGNRYLVERFNNVVITRIDKERLTRDVSATWTGYGFATSAPHKVELGGRPIQFGPLDFREEMQVFRNRDYPDGLIDGEVFTESHFNKASFFAALKRKRPLVHISSHFRFRPGDESQSFLLLGDGQIMTLAEMKEQVHLFEGVELLTLSACDTAAQQPDATGREIDAFAELAQRLGAGGVMATLWPVRDNSTALLMKGFYKNLTVGKLNKAEALRRAQLDLLHGNIQSSTTPVTRGSQTTRRDAPADEDIIVDARYRIPFTSDKRKPFAHPYYWSPFVLFGNWK